MTTEPNAEVDRLLRLTEEMLSLAIQGAWTEVEACEIQRIAAIESLAHFKGDTDRIVAAKYKQVLDKNAEVVALAIIEKNKIADELRLFKNLEKADKAYRDIGAGAS
ncbi:MAG: flagellar protein FliT [Gammaproteobacteria bacterium]|nr:flagellar protein FliT [Gammaproteobacteria bacterium]